MEKQLSFGLENLSSGKKKNSSPIKHLSGKKRGEKTKEQAGSQKRARNKRNVKTVIKKRGKLQNPIENQEKFKEQTVIELLPKVKEELKLKTLSLEGVKAEDTLKETSPDVHSPRKELLFENLVSVETVAEVLGLAPKTIRNWVSARRIPFVRVGRKVMFRRKSFELWLNRKEIKSWL